MNKYGGLLNKISKELKIKKGNTESEASYRSRIIYSTIGRMAYVSLWDTLEDYDLEVDGEPMSTTLNTQSTLLNIRLKF